MAFKLTGVFERKSKAAGASGTGTARSGFLTGSLPVIGRYALDKQFRILGALFLLMVTSATLLIFGYVRQTTEDSTYLEIALEMKTLSQQLAKSASQAVQGNAQGFEQLERGRDRFGESLKLLKEGGVRNIDKINVDPSPESVQPLVHDVEANWQTFLKNTNAILAQKKGLMELRRHEENVDQAVPRLHRLTQEVMTLVDLNSKDPRMGVFVRQMEADLKNYDFQQAASQLSTDKPNQPVPLMLGKNAEHFGRALKALAEGDPALGMKRVEDPAARDVLLELKTQSGAFKTAVDAILKDFKALAAAKQASRDILALSDDLLTEVTKLTEAYDAFREGRSVLLIAAAIFGFLAVAILLLIGKIFFDDAKRRLLASEQETRRNQEAILRLLDEMGSLAEGDLTVRAVVTEDITGAIADSVNFTVEELRTLVAGINKVSALLAEGTQSARGISGQLLEAAQKQSRQIIATTAQVTQMAQSINEVSSNAAECASVAEQSLAAAEKGKHAVQDSIAGMNDIRNQIQETAKQIKRLGESSQEIGEIVELIADITEQTNVLALNAAIQAASAGEAGRGFTVVAEEVQRLAERSAEATKQIGAIVKNIQTDTQETVSAMEKSTEGVVEETKRSDAAGQALVEIERVSKNLAQLIATISASTQSQAASAQSVACIMQDILDITAQTTKGTEGTAVSMQQIATLAGELKNSVAGFKL
jgi:twitching motility protein PilJ